MRLRRLWQHAALEAGRGHYRAVGASSPRQWKVIPHNREKFTCRDCEMISHAPTPFHVIARGWAGPSLLAMVLFEEFGQHQPLNRQEERYAKEGVALSLSTLAVLDGACAAEVMPQFRRMEAHVLPAERFHGDDATVPVLAKGKTDTGRLWIDVRDDKAFDGPALPAPDGYLTHQTRHGRGLGYGDLRLGSVGLKLHELELTLIL